MKKYTPSLIRVEMTVTARDKKLYAKLTFTNTGDYPLDLVKFITMPDGKADNHYFLIITITEKELEYRGAMKKRAHPGEDGFYWLEPNQSVQSGEICLHDYYQFPRKGGVEIGYSSTNHFAGYDTVLVSNPVTIGLTAAE